MSSKYVKNIVTAIAFVIMLFIGYIRETIFLVLNSVLYDYPFPYNRSYTEPPAFLMEWSDQTIVNVKWLLTFGFSVLFMFLTALIIRFYFKKQTLFGCRIPKTLYKTTVSRNSWWCGNWWSNWWRV